MTPETEKRATHTPTPWKVQDGIAGREGWIVAGDGSLPVAQAVGKNYKEKEANADFIVHAVNAYEDMFQALISFEAWAKQEKEEGRFIPGDLENQVHSAIAKSSPNTGER